MRATTEPALGAACGQLLLVDADAYRAVGGHAADRAAASTTRLMLVRHVPPAPGCRTDLVAGAGLAGCRMYDGLAPAWAGLPQERARGHGHADGAAGLDRCCWRGGHLLPLVAGCCARPAGRAGLLPRRCCCRWGCALAVTLRARESLWSVPLHPLTVATGLAIQWTALVRARLRPARSTWKGRAYHAG